MRKLTAVLAVAGLSALALTGCASGSTSASCPTPAPVGRAAGLVDVSGGEPGTVPTVTVAAPFHTDRVSYRTVVTGEGTPITAADQLVVLSYTLVNGDDGSVLGSTKYGDLSQVIPLSVMKTPVPDIQKALQCATPGSRIVLALPPDGIAPDARASLQLGDQTSTVMVIDVEKVYLSKADGANQYNAGTGLPTVVRTDSGRPGVSIPDGPAPTSAVVQTVKRGDGEKVTGSDPVRAHVLEVTWSDKEVVRNTWTDTPESLDVSTLPAVLADALKGATVGSQLLVVVPPGKDSVDTGDEKQAHVYVIDILGIDAAKTS